MPCSIAGMCSGAADCGDLRCPGHPIGLHRVAGFIDQDGGKAVSGGFGVSLRMALEPAAPEPQDEPIARPEDFGMWHVAAAGAAALVIAAGAVGALAYISRWIAAAF